MSRIIDTVTISSLEDRRCKLSACAIARPLGFGTNWKKLRIGVRWAFDDVGGNIVGTPVLYVGLMSTPTAGLANGPNGETTGHFLGWLSNGSQWTRGVVSSTTHYATAASGHLFATKVGAGFPSSSSSSSTHNFSAEPTAKRWPMFLDITRPTAPATTPFVLENCFWNQPVISAADISQTTMKAAMVPLAMADCRNVMTQALGGVSSFQANVAVNITVDEATNGTLNHVVVSWERTYPAIYISDIMHCKLL